MGSWEIGETTDNGEASSHVRGGDERENPNCDHNLVFNLNYPLIWLELVSWGGQEKACYVRSQPHWVGPVLGENNLP